MSTSSIFTPAPDNPGSNAAHAQHVVTDEDYFKDLSPVVFQVENCLFRVPRYHLVKGSEVFAEMFESLQIEGSSEGSSAESPIVLPVSRVDFRNLLKLLYPQTVLYQADLSKDEWLSVLKLSNLWYFRDLRQMALIGLEEDDFDHLSALEKVKLGKECYIPDCLLAGYSDFVTRDEPITDEEAIAMGPLTVVRLCRIREKFMFDDDGRSGESIVEEFREELDDLREHAEAYLPSCEPAGSSESTYPTFGQFPAACPTKMATNLISGFSILCP